MREACSKEEIDLLYDFGILNDKMEIDIDGIEDFIDFVYDTYGSDSVFRTEINLDDYFAVLTLLVSESCAEYLLESLMEEEE